MTEEWITIEEFEDYEVSSFGRIRSKNRIVEVCREDRGIIKKTCKSKIIAPYKDKDGYLQVILRKNKKKHRKKVHRLVLAAFARTMDGKRLCNHLDGNKQNNHFVNLEWCDHTGNIVHAFDNNLAPQGEKSHYAKLTGEEVLLIKQRLKNGESGASLARDFNTTTANISCIKTGKSWKRLLLSASHSPTAVPALNSPSSF